MPAETHKPLILILTALISLLRDLQISRHNFCSESTSKARVSGCFFGNKLFCISACIISVSGGTERLDKTDPACILVLVDSLLTNRSGDWVKAIFNLHTDIKLAIEDNEFLSTL